MKPNNLQKPNPSTLLPYLSLTLSYKKRVREKLLLAGMRVLKPLPCKGRGLPEGSVYTLKTFQTSSYSAQAINLGS
jgi:hypothetical protein